MMDHCGQEHMRRYHTSYETSPFISSTNVHLWQSYTWWCITDHFVGIYVIDGRQNIASLESFYGEEPWDGLQHVLRKNTYGIECHCMNGGVHREYHNIPKGCESGTMR
eukprot:1167086_1